MIKDKYQEEVDKNYEWFQKNKEKLIKENENKVGYYVLLKNKNVIGYYKDYEEVIIEAHKKFNDEPFSIQELEKEEKIRSLGFWGLKWAK